MNDKLSELVIDAWQNGVSLETLCLQYPHHADAIRQLINPLIKLQQVKAPTLPPRASQAQADFLRLAQHYRAQATAKPKQRRSLLTQRWLWATATIVVLLCLSGNLVLSASARALPGDNLYGVKRWSESLSLAFTPSDQQLSVRIELVNERQREIASLVALNKPVPNGLLDEVVNETQSIELALAPTHTNDPRRDQLRQANQQLQTTIAIIPSDNLSDDLKHHDLIETLDQSSQRMVASASVTPTQMVKVLLEPTMSAQPVTVFEPTDGPNIANPRVPPKPQTPTLEPTEVVLPTSTSTALPTFKPTKVPAAPVVKPIATATIVPTILPTSTALPTELPTATELPPATALPTSVPTSTPLATEIPSIGLPTATTVVVRNPTVVVPTKIPDEIKPTEVPTPQPTSAVPTKEPPAPVPTKEPEDSKGQPQPISHN
ncbi:DUF5667 domain-containing protein [Herpetosiphon llansteffanensis]|uniref:DUF5667 domain-containing protein n=1 Tax=Herpetosiphon llansteffanensis TaxID=2094568 RepID=UPI000D7CF34D|nr:DUF5667 domain-containing protein [Herpetosiphon llansteffanensis]